MLIDALDEVSVVEYSHTVAARYAGRILGEFGAHVMRLPAEPANLDPDRAWWLDVGKLVEESREETERTARLTSRGASADVLLHDVVQEDPALPDELIEALREANPALIIFGLTPYGATGPYRLRQTLPLIDLHAGGEGWELVQQLAPDGSEVPARPPAMTGGDATELYCGLMAAVAVLAALRRRQFTGQGNVLDMSRQEASMWPARVELSGYPNAGVRDRRRTRERMPGGVLKTKDGWVEIMPFEERMWAGLIATMGDPHWAAEPRYQDRMERLARAQELNPLIAAWTKQHTAKEVYERLQANGCPAYQVMMVDQLASSPQYTARSFFVTVNGKTIPSTPYTGPKPTYQAPAGLPERLPSEQALVARHRSDIRGFLDGIRVLDLTFNRAGPSCTAALAAMGAEVIRVESHARIDSNRLRRSVAGKVIYGNADDSDLDTRWAFGSINMGKKSILLNLQSPNMPKVLRELVKASDLVAESFTPGTMERYGIGFDTLRAWKRDVILVSVNGFGRNGPHSGYRAYADIFGAAGGLQELTGYPDEAPMQFVGRLDSVVGSFALAGCLAAIIKRELTGEGQHVDVSAAEAVTSMLGTPMMDYLDKGVVASRSGNRVRNMAPHNCYRCKDPDDWVAVAIASDADWAALCKAIDRPELSTDSRYRTLDARKQNEESLDAAIEHWTQQLDSYTAAETLQAVGIASTPSMRPDQLFADPHLAERGAWVQYEHAVQGKRFDLRLPWLSENGQCSYRPAPLFGQHSTEVYEQLLGMTTEEIFELQADQTIY